MAAIPIIDPTLVGLVKSTEQYIGVAGEAINAGQPVMEDPVTGQLMRATEAGDEQIVGVSISTCNMAGLAVTAIRRGIIDLGPATLEDQDFGDPIYLGATAGTYDDARTIRIGQVVAGMGSRPFDKLLHVDM